MATNLARDEGLLAQAQRLGRHRTKKETVNAALRDFIERGHQARIVSPFGKIDMDPRYGRKKARDRT